MIRGLVVPGFVFRLQAVLEHRSHVEQEKMLAVAAIERERQALERALAERQREIRACKEDLRAMLGGGDSGVVDPRPVRLQAAAAFRAQAQSQRLLLQLAGVHRRLESAKEELRRASSAKRAVELLKARRHSQWKREMDRRDSAEMDEIGTRAAVRALLAERGER